MSRCVHQFVASQVRMTYPLADASSCVIVHDREDELSAHGISLQDFDESTIPILIAKKPITVTTSTGHCA